jgi:septal ring factor EnvC (AmiA/AmiB activator)
VILAAVAEALVLAAAVAAAAEAPPGSPDGGTTSDRLKKVHERRVALEREVTDLRSEEQGLLGEVERLELEVRLREQELREIQLTLRRTREEMDGAQRRAAALEKSLAVTRPAVVARARALYKLGEFSYLRLLLSVDRPVDVLRAYRFVSALAREDKERVARFRKDLTALDTTRSTLDRKGKEALDLRAEVERRRKRLDAEHHRKTELLTSLVERKEVHLSYLEELEQAEGRLRELLDSGAGEEAAVPIAAFRGSLPWPVIGKVRVGFGPRKHPKFDTITPHNGLEIEAPAESAVCAVHEGTVAFAGRFPGYGLMVLLDHGGKHHTVYAHLAEVRVSVGDHVTAGNVLGVLSPEDPADLYFELRFQSRPVDPSEWLSRPDKR